MSEELVNKVQEMLKEETWTRSAVGNYTVSNLEKLSEIVKQAQKSDLQDQIKEICDEKIVHSKDDCIMALYISGMIDLNNNSLDNANLVTLLDIFKTGSIPKENLIEKLCQDILANKPENLFALRELAEHYKRTDEKTKMWELYETIVKLDIEEADLAKELAKHYDEGTDKKEKGIMYYKKALLRYIATKNVSNIDATWNTLLDKIPQDVDFFKLAQKKVAKSISEIKSATYISKVYEKCIENSQWDTAIELIKLVLNIDPKDRKARDAIVTCYRGKYANHSRLDEYISKSDLTSSFRDVFEAIDDFEKHIAFDTNNFVYHRTWGIGRIEKVMGEKLTINFGKKNGSHELTTKMAIESLQPLATDHFWVIKAVVNKDKLKKKTKDDVRWALEKIIKSFPKCDSKKIKEELVPAVLTAGEWTSWHSKAQRILETDPRIGVSPTDINNYIIRDHDITQDEKLAMEFKAEKEFFPRVDIYMRYLQLENFDSSDENFLDMYNFFAGWLKTSEPCAELVGAYLVINYTKERFNVTNPADYTFAELYDSIENPRKMYKELKDSKISHLREMFLKNIRDKVPEWDDKYIHLFPTVLKEEILKELESKGKEEKLTKLVKEAFDNFRDYRETVIYFFDKCQGKEWFKAANLSEEKQLVTLINIISLCYLEINNHVNSTENKKIINNICNLIFDKNILIDFMFQGEEERCNKMYTMVNDVKDLAPQYKSKLRAAILNKYPDFKFKETETKAEAPKGTLVTAAMVEIKKKEIESLEKEELPAVAVEISVAREKGDLKENAEYHSAKEKQHYLNQKLTSLKNEMDRAVIFDITTLTTAMVSFGTEVVLHNELENKDETYSIFGPWESNPDKGIISYLSPFGDAILDAKVGETKDFTVNGTRRCYTVKEIRPAKM